jgi:uncharacterized protein YacL
MSIFNQLMFGNPTYTALTGERRKAFVRQSILSGVIGVGMIIALGVTAIMQRHIAHVHFVQIEHKLLVLLVVLLGVQFLYALVRRETVWQLRTREWRNNVAQGNANKAELLEFAAKLEQKK